MIKILPRLAATRQLICTRNGVTFLVLPPPPHPAVNPFECKHVVQKMEPVTDVSGKKFMLSQCCRCAMEIVYGVDDAGKMTKLFSRPAAGWIH